VADEPHVAVQCRHETVLVGIRVRTSNNHPSEPFSHLYSIHILTVISIIKILVCSVQVKNKARERCTLCVCSWAVSSDVSKYCRNTNISFLLCIYWPKEETNLKKG
jgi:hypothetical protein